MSTVAVLAEFYAEKLAALLRHQPRAGLVLQQRCELLAVERLEQGESAGHAFCFSLQLMQTLVQGIAFRRASAIGSPQSRHTP